MREKSSSLCAKSKDAALCESLGNVSTNTEDNEDKEVKSMLQLWLCLGLGLVLALGIELRLVLSLGLGLGLWLGLRLVSVETEERKKEKAKIQKEKEDREHFLKLYPQAKQDYEEFIAYLYALADRKDKVHRNCTIAKATARFGNIVSNVLTVVGMATEKENVSLTLTATGIGLESAAAVTSVTTDIVEHSLMSMIDNDANSLTSSSTDQMMMIKKILSDGGPKIASLGNKVMTDIKDINKNICAIRSVNNPPVAAHDKQVMATGETLARNPFEGTVVKMTTKEKLKSGTVKLLSLGRDVYDLSEEFKHLREGAKSESAEQLRHLARELEMELEEFKKKYSLLIGPESMTPKMAPEVAPWSPPAGGKLRK